MRHINNRGELKTPASLQNISAPVAGVVKVVKPPVGKGYAYIVSVRQPEHQFTMDGHEIAFRLET